MNMTTAHQDRYEIHILFFFLHIAYIKTAVMRYEANTALTLLCIVNSSCVKRMFTQLSYGKRRVADWSSWCSINFVAREHGGKQ